MNKFFKLGIAALIAVLAACGTSVQQGSGNSGGNNGGGNANPVKPTGFKITGPSSIEPGKEGSYSVTVEGPPGVATEYNIETEGTCIEARKVSASVLVKVSDPCIDVVSTRKLVITSTRFTEVKSSVEIKVAVPATINPTPGIVLDISLDDKGGVLVGGPGLKTVALGTITGAGISFQLSYSGVWTAFGPSAGVAYTGLPFVESALRYFARNNEAGKPLRGAVVDGHFRLCDYAPGSSFYRASGQLAVPTEALGLGTGGAFPVSAAPGCGSVLKLGVNGQAETATPVVTPISGL